MGQSDNIELIGTIRDLVDRHEIRTLHISLLDAEGRLVGLTYEYPSHAIAESIYRSLNVGMKIKVLVKGPFVDEKSTYDGVGLIRVVEDKR